MPKIEKPVLRLLPLVLLALTGAARPAEPPRRIVSLNLCADQLVLALADRRQFAALTSMATDTGMSAEAVRARGVPVSRGGAEDVLALNPDLIVTSPYWRGTSVAALRSQNYRIVSLADAPNYAAIVAQIRQVARAVGHPMRGEAMIARMDANLAALPKAGGGKVAAYYQRRGYVTGTDTLVDELMERVGLRNLAGMLGKPHLARLSVEEMVAARPDYLIVETATDTVADQGTEMLHHPALARIKRLRVPEAWTVCGGPAYVKAARSLSAQLRASRSR